VGFPVRFLPLIKRKWKLSVWGGENAGLQGFRTQLPKLMCKYVGVCVAGFRLFRVRWVHAVGGWSGAAGAPCLEGQVGSVGSAGWLRLLALEFPLADVGLLVSSSLPRDTRRLLRFLPSLLCGR